MPVISWLRFPAWPHRARLLLMFVFGALAVMGFAPFGAGLLSLPLLAALVYLWLHTEKQAHAFQLGWAFGMGLMGFGVFWLRVSIAQFGGIPLPVAIFIALGFAAIVATYFGLCGWLAVGLRRRLHSTPAVFLVLIVPACWALVEWLRGWLLTGFPWLSVGYSQLDLPLAGFAPVLGVYGVGLLMLVSIGLILMWRRYWGVIGAASLWVCGLALGMYNWTAPSGAQIQVSLVQGNIPQDQKWQRDMFRPTLDLYQELTALVRESRLVVWPETAVPAFDTAVEEDILLPLQRQMADQGRDLLLGIVVDRGEHGYHNAMMALGKSGRDAYYKRHLVPFGEYLPFRPLLADVLDWLQIPMSNFRPGDDGRPGLVTLAGYPVGVDICYEDAFGEEIIRALPEAAFLINASNDAWFGDSLAPHQHLQIARMRALETGRFLLRSTNTGISALIDHRGELRAVSPHFKTAVLTGLVTPMQGLTPYVRWGNAAVVILALSMLLGAAALRHRPRP